MLDNNKLKIGIIILLLINTVLLVYILLKKDSNQQCDKSEKREGWIANPSATYVKPAAIIEPDYGQKTYAGCSCVGYGIKNNKTMPFNDDSNLYAKTIYQGY
jgi:hypothetical protein